MTNNALYSHCSRRTNNPIGFTTYSHYSRVYGKIKNGQFVRNKE